MREQEFRARDKVVQKMSRGGLQEKNLTKGTEQVISQRDSDYSFQTQGDGKWEEGMAGRTAAKGRESPRPDRNRYSRQTERDGGRDGVSQASQDMEGLRSLSAAENGSVPETFREHGESQSTAYDGRQEEHSHAQPDTVQQGKLIPDKPMPDKPIPDRRTAGPGQGRTAAAQGREAGKDSTECRGGEGGGQSRNRETPGYGEGSPGKSREPVLSGQQRKRKVQRDNARAWRERYAPSENLSQDSDAEASRKPIKAEKRAEAGKNSSRTAAGSSEHRGGKYGKQKEEGSNGEGNRRAARKGRLQFESYSESGKQEESLLKRTGGGLVHTAQSAAIGKFHQKIREVEQNNAGVESAHKAEAVVERAAGRAYRMGRERLRSRPYRAMKRAEKRAITAERDAALKKFQAEYPQMQKKALAKWVQKQKIKRKYAAAAREASKGAGRSAKILSATGRIAKQAAEYIKKKAGGTAVGIILAGVLLFSLCGALFTSCSSLLTGAGSSLMSACYLAEDGEISSTELRYSEMETDLQMEIADTERHHPGYDEYRYNIGEIGHNPFELMGYLSAVFDDFTFTQVEAELDRLFGLQYRLTREEITETRTYTDEEGEEQEYEWRILKTVLSVRPLSEILSGSLAAGEQADRYAVYMETYGGRQYFGSPFDFPWLGSVTSSYGYRVHPIRGGKDLHRGVDIGAASGTPIRAIQDGQVVSAGEAGGYGLCIVIAGEDGYQSRYAHCSSLAASAGQEVRKGDIVAYVGNTGDSTGPHLHLEVARDGEYLNPVYFVENGGGGYTPGGNAAGRPQFPADPGAPMGDGTFQAIREEAERHMGRPYVWGGSSPETSFDCSGYVSWVINQSGAGSVGRQTAQGLCNLCIPVAWEDLQPGDLVFFTGTYSSLTPVSHVGIYMGGGRMAHAGDPIGYVDIGSSRYWKQHFYCGGRLP